MGFIFTGRMGTGHVVARLPDGRWSAPSAIGPAGVGWGPQIGGEIMDFVIILNTQRAVKAFCASDQVNLGAELGILWDLLAAWPREYWRPMTRWTSYRATRIRTQRACMLVFRSRVL